MASEAGDRWAAWLRNGQWQGLVPTQRRKAAARHRRIRDRVLSGARVREGHRVLDVGAGTGLLALEAMRRVGDRGQVIALDVSIDALRGCRDEAIPQSGGGRLHLVQGRAERIPLDDGAVDAAIMRSVLIYVPDKARAVGGPLRVGLWRRRFWAPAVARAGLPHWFARSRQGERCKWCSQTEESLTHERRFGVHGLRHTAVALWIAAGASPKEVAARAGHTSVVTVLDRYGHLYEDSDERLTERLDAVRVAAGTGRTRDGHGSTALARLPAVNGNPA